MSNLLTPGQEVYQEALQIARFQGVDGPEFSGKIKLLSRHFDTYVELMLSERGFEVATMGEAADLAETALLCGASPLIVETFAQCARAFPGKKLGLKLYFGPATASLSMYVRVMAPCQEGLDFLSALPHLADLVPSLAEMAGQHRIMYYIGLKEDRQAGTIWPKTYHIDEVGQKMPARSPEQDTDQEVLGFVSYEAYPGGPLRIKYYVDHVGWDKVVFPTARWLEIADFARNRMGYGEMSYFGMNKEGSQLKLYIERIGAVPTEYDSR